MSRFGGLPLHRLRRVDIQTALRVGPMIAKGLALKALFGTSNGLLLVGRQTRVSNPQFIHHAGRLVIEDGAELQGLSERGIRLGMDVSIGAGARIRPSSYYGGPVGVGMTLGDRSSIASDCFIGCSGEVTIGDDVMIGPGVKIFSENHSFQDLSTTIKSQGVVRSHVRIGDDCWIGSGVIITAGVTIGAGAVIGSGSVVTRDVPSRAIAVGNPARVLRQRGTAE